MSERQNEESLQPPATSLVITGARKKVIPVPFEGRTSSHQRMNLTPPPVQLPQGDLQTPASGPQQGPQYPAVLPEHLAPQNSEDLSFQGQHQQQSERDRMLSNSSNEHIGQNLKALQQNSHPPPDPSHFMETRRNGYMIPICPAPHPSSMMDPY